MNEELLEDDYCGCVVCSSQNDYPSQNDKNTNN
jgi:hypothetical protein